MVLGSSIVCVGKVKTLIFCIYAFRFSCPGVSRRTTYIEDTRKHLKNLLVTVASIASTSGFTIGRLIEFHLILTPP